MFRKRTPAAQGPSSPNTPPPTSPSPVSPSPVSAPPALPRRPWLGALLLMVYLGSLVAVAVGVYRIGHLAAVVAESEPIVESQRLQQQRLQLAQSLREAIARKQAEMVRATRFALVHGPPQQQIAILRQIGTEDYPAAAFIEQVRLLTDSDNPGVASEAARTIRRVRETAAEAR